MILSSSSVFVSDYESGTLSACAAEVALECLSLRSSSVARAVVRESTAFTFISVSGSDDF